MNFKLKDILKRELSEFSLVASCALLIVAVWFLFFQWRTSLTMVWNDQIMCIYPLFRIFEGGGIRENAFYEFGFSGGMNLSSFIGMTWLVGVAHALSLKPYSFLTAIVFFNQTVIAYWSVKVVYVLEALWRNQTTADAKLGKKNLHRYLRVIVVTIIAAFSPIVAWRVWACHLQHLLQSTVILGTLLIILQVHSKKLSITNVIIYASVLVASLQSPAMQIPIYSLVFGLPLLAGVWAQFSLKDCRNSLIWCVSLSLIAMFITRDQLLNVWAIAKSGEISRGMEGVILTFTYTTQTITDWFSSMFFQIETINSGRNPFQLHETNYPFGPYFLLFLVFYPWKKWWKMGAGITFAFAITAMFSSDVSWISATMLAICPILKEFRVPARAILQIIIVLIPISIACLECFLVEKVKSIDKVFLAKVLLLVSMYLLLMYFLPGDLHDLFMYISLLFAIAIKVYDVRKKDVFEKKKGVKSNETAQQYKQASFYFITIVLAFSSLFAFRERVPELLKSSDIQDAVETARSEIKRTAPQALEPLNRSVVSFFIPMLMNTTGYNLGLSTLEGSGFYNKYFIEFLFSLYQQSKIPIINTLGMRDFAYFFPIYQKLFNVCFNFKINQKTRKIEYQYTPEDTWGAVWLPQTKQVFASVRDITDYLRFHDPSKLALLKNTLLIEHDQWSLISNEFKIGNFEGCSASTPPAVSYQQHWQKILITMDKGQSKASNENCPLIVSTNFSKFLKVIGKKSNGESISLQTFRAYGVLLGISVPSDVVGMEIYWSKN